MQALAILFGAVFTAAVCISLGGLVLREGCRDWGARFVVGAAALSTAVFVMCAAGAAYWWMFLALGVAAIAAGWPALRVMGRPGGRIPYLVFGVYFVLYLAHAMAPEASPDGAGYHLGLVARYLGGHGFVRITDNLYAAMPGGMEMLFLFAFAFGKHSAAAMVHFGFLLALTWQIYSYARRAGFAIAGWAAALLVFASPAVGMDATSAYNDVAVAATAFTLFHLLEVWSDERQPRVLWAVGLLAGFAFAIKYTAWLGVVYAVGFVAWKNRRAALAVAAIAGVTAGPWLLKNWVYLQNPVAPFFNHIFPNPYVMVSFEETYRRVLAASGLASRWQIPWEAAVRGGLGGFLGPVFLLAPIGLLALRRREGRHLWLAALVFGANYFSNIGTRFLIPMLPFVALAMMLALQAVPRAAIALALLHAVISWPWLTPRYARPDSWRLEKLPWREALRIKPEDAYLESHLIGYGIDRLIESHTRPGSTVFTFTPIPEAYTSRHIRVDYQSAENKIAGAILWSAVEPASVPTWRLRFAFPRQALTGLRLVQTGTGASEELWSIHELRVFDGARELERAPGWRLTAHPYPWGIQDAFDNSLATFWLCGESLRPGQYVEVAFPRDEMADAVVMEAAPNQPDLRVRLEVRYGAGKWQVLSGAPAVSDAPRPLGLRRAAAEELRRRGIGYVLLFDGQVGADDFRTNSDLWDARAVGQYKGARLYELQ